MPFARRMQEVYNIVNRHLERASRIDIRNLPLDQASARLREIANELSVAINELEAFLRNFEENFRPMSDEYRERKRRIVAGMRTTLSQLRAMKSFYEKLADLYSKLARLDALIRSYGEGMNFLVNPSYRQQVVDVLADVLASARELRRMGEAFSRFGASEGLPELASLIRDMGSAMVQASRIPYMELKG